VHILFRENRLSMAPLDLSNAIEKFSIQLQAEHNDFFTPGYTTINVGVITGGTAKNIIPGQCKFQLEWRPLPGTSGDSVLQSITKIAEQMRADDPAFKSEIKVLRQQAGFETVGDSHLVRSIERLTQRSATSIPFALKLVCSPRLPKEIVVFGPGDMQTAHSRRECVPLSEYTKRSFVSNR